MDVTDDSARPSLPPAPALTPPAGLGRLSALTLLDVVLAGLVVAGGTFLITVLLMVMKRAGVDLGPPGLGLGGLPVLLVPLTVLATMAAGVGLWLLHRRRLPTAPQPWTRMLVAQAAVVAVALQALAYGYYEVADRLGLTLVGSNVDAMLSAFNAHPLLTAFAIVVAAPVGEELLFRRVLLHRFAHAGRPLLGLLLSSVFFAVLHEPLPGERSLLVWALVLLPYAAIGAVFGQLYLRSQRIGVAILAHALLNAIALLMVVSGTR